jgi:hypothetical protein
MCKDRFIIIIPHKNAQILWLVLIEWRDDLWSRSVNWTTGGVCIVAFHQFNLVNSAEMLQSSTVLEQEMEAATAREMRGACLPRELRGLVVVGMRGRHPGGAEVDGAPAEAADELVAPRDLLPHLQYRFDTGSWMELAAVTDKSEPEGEGRKDAPHGGCPSRVPRRRIPHPPAAGEDLQRRRRSESGAREP